MALFGCAGLLIYTGLVLVVVFGRPPMTPSGRAFYLMTGVIGLFVGGIGLCVMAEMHGFDLGGRLGGGGRGLEGVARAIYGTPSAFHAGLLLAAIYLSGVGFFVAAVAWPWHPDEADTEA